MGHETSGHLDELRPVEVQRGEDTCARGSDTWIRHLGKDVLSTWMCGIVMPIRMARWDTELASAETVLRSPIDSEIPIPCSIRSTS